MKYFCSRAIGRNASEDITQVILPNFQTLHPLGSFFVYKLIRDGKAFYVSYRRRELLFKPQNFGFCTLMLYH